MVNGEQVRLQYPLLNKGYVKHQVIFDDIVVSCINLKLLLWCVYLLQVDMRIRKKKW